MIASPKSMVPRLSRVLIACAAFSSSQVVGAEASSSHCRGDEIAYYNCLVEGSGETASVCGRNLGDGPTAGGYLQYRFGFIGNAEFEFPPDAETFRETFLFESQSTRDGSTQDYFMWFRRADWIYEVYYREEFENCGQTGCSSERTGQAAFVSVWQGFEAWRTGDELKGKRLRCSNPAENEVLKGLGKYDFYDADKKARIFRRSEG